LFLALTDSEQLGSANRADALCCRSPILHGDGLWILDFPLGPAFHAISLHIPLLFGFCYESNLTAVRSQEGESRAKKGMADSHPLK
jgi:hypothetical protein